MAQIDKPNLHFNTKLYSGNGSTNAITGVGFAPNFVWIKERSSTSSHVLGTTIQGTGKRLSSNTTDAEASLSNIFTSFDSDGFTHGADNGVNESGQTYVSWNWLGGGTASSNTDGSITSSVSANTTAGFSIVSYTGTAANATVGHGLGSAPNVIFFKSRGNASTNWYVYHSSLGQGTRITLNSTSASASDTEYMNNTAPTNSVFSLGANGTTNPSSANQIAYCFAEKKGFSKFGSYTGNGSSTDGTFVYTGFKPSLIIGKVTNTTGDWYLWDNKRLGYNRDNNKIKPNTSAAETTEDWIDMYSNGFKFYNNSGDFNYSGYSFVYMAFAENPIVGSNNIPAVAR